MSEIAEAAARAAKTSTGGRQLALRCGACGTTGRYRVGVVAVNVQKLETTPDEAVAFTAIFACRSCRADGPWKVPMETRIRLMAALLAKEDGVLDGDFGLCDGTPVRSGADAVRELRRRLAEQGESAELWRRLGNSYRTGGLLGEAAGAWERAIALDPTDILAHFDLGRLAVESDALAEGVPHLHAVLRLAREKRRSVPLGTLRGAVKDAVEMLFDVREELGDGIDLFPPDLPPLGSGGAAVARGTAPATLYLTELDLSSERGWDRLADFFMGTGEVVSFLESERKRMKKRRRGF